MNILYITCNKFEKSGGGICAESLFDALVSTENNVDLYSPNERFNSIYAKKNKVNDIVSRVFLHSNFMFVNWIKNRKKIFEKKYDVIFLSNSRLGFIAKDVKKNNPNTKIIIHFDNIEYDYCKHYFGDKNSLMTKLKVLIESLAVKRDESNAIQYSDRLIFLTSRDKNRCEEIYKFKRKSSIIPICLNKIDVDLRKNRSVNIVFLGSLWYKPNHNSIVWFLNEVWPTIKIKFPDLNFIIAGRNPNNELKELIKNKNANILPNFSTIEDVIDKNSIFISPIIEGAGMKVKVAEAMSYGVPIIASTESLVGYEEVVGMDFIYKADTKQQYEYAIENIINKSFDDKKIISEFNKFYSQQRCNKEISLILNEII